MGDASCSGLLRNFFKKNNSNAFKFKIIALLLFWL